MDVKRIQHSKWLGRFLPIDIVVTMGCGGNGSDLPCKHWGDWGFDPPTGCSEVVFEETIQVIKKEDVASVVSDTSAREKTGAGRRGCLKEKQPAAAPVKRGAAADALRPSLIFKSRVAQSFCFWPSGGICHHRS